MSKLSSYKPGSLLLGYGMKEFIFKLGNKPSSPTKLPPLRTRVRDELLINKLDTPLGYLIFSLLALCISYYVAHGGEHLGWTLLVNALLIPCLVGAIFHIRFGLYMTLGLAFVFSGAERLVPELQLGFFLDTTIIFMLFGVFVQQTREKDWSFLLTPISTGVAIWVIYNLFEFANPWAVSRIAWLHSFRLYAGMMMVTFVGLYALKELSSVKRVATIWIALVLISAIYGLIQEFRGLSEIEWNWTMEVESRFDQVFSWGRYRKFSIMAGPSVFGVILATTSLFALSFMIGQKSSRRQRILLGIAIFIMLWAMVYTGTRTAFLLIPAGLFFLMLLSPNLKTLIPFVVSSVIVLGLIFIPSENIHLRRLQSSFEPGASTSFQERIQNQKYIQPYIQTHPIGAGLGSTGEMGRIYSPGTLLAEFPPDSGYVRIAVEMGWVGLMFYCGLMLLILVVGVRNYFRIRDPRLKKFQAAFLVLIFSLIIANYPQPILTQLPGNIIFFISIAIIVNLRRMNDKIVEEKLTEISLTKKV